MYGGRQYATVDQGWIGWFCDEALRIERREKDRVEIAGNGKQVRDVLHAQDMVSLYFATTDRMADATGHAFNIGGGMNNSLSLRELFRLIGELTGLDIPFLSSPPRVSDQRVFVADIKKAERLLRWHPAVHPREGVAEMLEWCRTRQAAP
jgi:CDP-paratose 2-epimerase